jgi:methionine aminopeptidase
MWKGIEQVRPGAHLGDIGHAIQAFAEGHGFSVVREFCGHGIGRGFHEEPQVLHYGKPGTLVELVPGMVFTIEPGIYIEEEQMGVRIENNVWITKTGNTDLMKNIPIKVEEIEKSMK